MIIFVNLVVQNIYVGAKKVGDKNQAKHTFIIGETQQSIYVFY